MDGNSDWAREEVNNIANRVRDFDKLVANAVEKLSGYYPKKLEAIIAKSFSKLIEASVESDVLAFSDGDGSLNSSEHEMFERERLDREIIAAVVMIKAAEKCIAIENKKPVKPLMHTADKVARGRRRSESMAAEPLGTSHIPRSGKNQGLLQVLGIMD